MSVAKFNTWQNPDGTENYKCRAWVNFNGTGTVAIRAAGNVGSITDNGVGDYTVNFTAAMPDANYAASISCSSSSLCAASLDPTAARTPAAYRFKVINGSYANVDEPYPNVAIFR